MNDKTIVELLIARNNMVTEQFFYKNCRPLFISIMRNVFSFKVDYDEFVNELYLYLMENDAARLRQFEGRGSLYQWLKITAIHFFIAKRNRMIDMEPEESPNRNGSREIPSGPEPDTTAKIDVERLLQLMPNKRFAYVLRRLILEEADYKEVADELHVSVDNLYNIKKRAIASLTQIAINEIGKHGKNKKK